MCWYVFNSANQLEGARRNHQFKLDESYSSKPSEFEIIFLNEGIYFIYGFKLNRERIFEEWYYFFPKGQQRLLFERTYKKNQTYSYKYGPSWKGGKKNIENATKEMSLFLTAASMLNNDLALIVKDWFMNTRFVSRDPEKEYEIDLTCEKSYETKYKQQILHFLQTADLGILDYNMEKKIQFKITTTHHGKNLNGEKNLISFDFDEESDGTKKLYSLSGSWLIGIEEGKTFISDELDTSLHPFLTELLIKHIHQNDSNAQLVFTTHDASLLDQDLFRRDQIWFTEKKYEEGCSDLYSLWNFKARKNENIHNGYLAGKYGAVPLIGDHT